MAVCVWDCSQHWPSYQILWGWESRNIIYFDYIYIYQQNTLSIIIKDGPNVQIILIFIFVLDSIMALWSLQMLQMNPK